MSIRVAAVHREELLAFFQGLGLKDDFEAGGIRCFICSDVLNENNFKVASRHAGNLVFCCQRAACYLTFLGDPTELQSRDS